MYAAVLRMSTDWLNDCSQMDAALSRRHGPVHSVSKVPRAPATASIPPGASFEAASRRLRMRLAQGRLGRDLRRRITLECMEMRLNWRRNAIELTTHRRLRGAFLGPVRLARVGFLRRSHGRVVSSGATGA